MNFNKIYDLFTGKCIRKIKTDKMEVFLTFDDGPDKNLTPKVLSLLDKFQAKATFFVIANNAINCESLVKEILKKGHTIGNHSLDHNTNMYFKGKIEIKNWIIESENALKNLTGLPSVGFRSPLGMKTPSLLKALKELSSPLILWDTRYYDTNYILNKKRINRSLKNISKGSIILLHDTHQKNPEDFLVALEYLIGSLTKKGFQLMPLTKELIKG